MLLDTEETAQELWSQFVLEMVALSMKQQVYSLRETTGWRLKSPPWHTPRQIYYNWRSFSNNIILLTIHKRKYVQKFMALL